jgi:hypothetical protein
MRIRLIHIDMAAILATTWVLLAVFGFCSYQ